MITIHKGAEMKYFDKVKLIGHPERYTEDEVSVGEVGVIWEPMIQDDEFFVLFHNDKGKGWYKYACIKIEDLEIVEDGGFSEEKILKALPKNDPRWWCKVEDGYILNLLGEKKNKIPYNYNS